MPKSFQLHKNQGSSGTTYIYENGNSNLFFVKYLDRSKQDYEDLKSRMIEEFVTLKIMNLLGLKTPAEFYLLRKPYEDFILVKRQVAEGEENKKTISDSMRGKDLRDLDSQARRAFVLDVLGITDLLECNNSEILYPDKDEKSRRLIDYDPLLLMESKILSFNRTVEYLSQDPEDGVKMPKKDFVAALRKTRAYFEQNKTAIYDSVNVIEDKKRRELLVKRLNAMEEMLMQNVFKFSPKETTHEDAPDASFYLARKVGRSFNFDDFKVAASGVIPVDIARFQIVEGYIASDTIVPDIVVANKLHRIQNLQEKGGCTIL